MIKGIKIIYGNNHKDQRGFIWTSWKQKKNDINFNHDKFSTFKRNVFKGFHWDNKTWKLMSCVFGKILLTIVNCKKESDQYLEFYQLELSHTKNIQVLIPPMFGNSTLCLSDEAVLHYKLSYNGKYNDTNKQYSMKWHDKRLKINWPKVKFVLSKRDK
jgi:dTDP-4-dehydrorhamnose 3,5-epimerase